MAVMLLVLDVNVCPQLAFAALVLTVSQNAAAKGLDIHPAVEKYSQKKKKKRFLPYVPQPAYRILCVQGEVRQTADTFCKASMVIVLMHSFVKTLQCFDSPSLTLLGFDVQAPCCVSYMTVI